MITLKTNSEIKISIVGGDKRQLSAASELVKKGFYVVLCGFDLYDGDTENIFCSENVFDAVSDSDAVVLPLPFSSDGRSINCPFGSDTVGFEELLQKMKKGQLLLGGRFEEKDIELARSYGVNCIDYFKREELNIMNAVPTAEGAIAIAMNELPITIHGSKSLVLGYGRIGKMLSRELKALGSDVTVFARKTEDIVWATSLGLKAENFHNLKSVSADADVIFNTVPHTVIGEDILLTLRKDTLIIDLASKPGGVDLKSARESGVKVIWALSLPGKVAPVTAGKIIEKSILNIMIEEGVISPV